MPSGIMGAMAVTHAEYALRNALTLVPLTSPSYLNSLKRG